MKPGLLITFEGIEGVGKSTNMAFAHEFLSSHNLPVIVTREPGGTEVAEAIRQVLLSDYKETITPHTELLLMFAGRAQHLANKIQPALSEGTWVICDRFTDASFAYQGGGRQLPLAEVESLESMVQGDLRPDLTIIFDAPVEVGLARANHRGDVNRFEREQVDFFTRVRDTYLARAAEFPERYEVINAALDLPEVQAQLSLVLEALMQRAAK